MNKKGWIDEQTAEIELADGRTMKGEQLHKTVE
jgi:hypothetical protein